MAKRKAYIFRGAPSSGKGTLTKQFVKLLKGKVALLELDMFRWSFHLYNREIENITESEHEFAYRNFLLMLDSYSKNGNYTLVIEGLFSWDKNGCHGNMNEVLNILNKYDFSYKVFLLKASYETLLKRNNKREYSVPEQEFRELYEYVGAENPKKEIIISVEDKTIKETVNVLSNLI